MPLEGSPHPSQFRCRHHTKSRLIQTSLQLPLLITGFITRGFRSNDSSVCEWLFELLLRLLEHFFTPDDVYEWIGTLQDCGSRDKSIRCLRGGVEGEIEALWRFLAQLARIALETSSRSEKTKIRAEWKDSTSERVLDIENRTESLRWRRRKKRQGIPHEASAVALGFESFSAIFGEEYFRPLNHEERESR